MITQTQKASVTKELSIIFDEMQQNKGPTQMINFTSKLSILKTSPEYPSALFDLLSSDCQDSALSFVVSLLKDLLLDIKTNFPESKQSKPNL